MQNWTLYNFFLSISRSFREFIAGTAIWFRIDFFITIMFYKQLFLGMQFVKQLLGINHLAISNNTKLRAKQKWFFFLKQTFSKLTFDMLKRWRYSSCICIKLTDSTGFLTKEVTGGKTVVLNTFLLKNLWRTTHLPLF